MAESTYYAMTSDEYSKIADAIRTKTGKTGQLLGSEFATAIAEIDSNDPSYAWNSEEVVINTGDIPDYAFYNNTKIKKATIGAGVTSIGKFFCKGCTALETVVFKATNCTCNYNATSSDSNVAFNGCNALKEVVFEGVETIPAHFLGSYSQRTTNPTITIPNTVKTIGNYAFIRFNGLKQLTIPDSVTSIGQSAFEGCTGLTSITIPDGVTSIGQSAFSGCTGLTNITIPDSVTSIGQSAFQGCTGLTSITIPDSVTSIGQYAFQGCTGLTSITIPDGVTSIGQSAFSGCTGLTSITIMGKPYFNIYCFQNTSKVERLVMKDTTGVPTLSSTNCFYGSSLCNSSSTAKIYVSSNLLTSYQSATNWSNSTIKAKLAALPDKITIDGTEYASTHRQTWQEWCESENNTDGFVVSGNNILNAGKTAFVELVNEKDTDGNITRKTPVLPTDLAIELEHITTAI